MPPFSRLSIKSSGLEHDLPHQSAARPPREKRNLLRSFFSHGESACVVAALTGKRSILKVVLKDVLKDVLKVVLAMRDAEVLKL